MKPCFRGSRCGSPSWSRVSASPKPPLAKSCASFCIRSARILILFAASLVHEYKRLNIPAPLCDGNDPESIANAVYEISVVPEVAVGDHARLPANTVLRPAYRCAGDLSGRQTKCPGCQSRSVVPAPKGRPPKKQPLTRFTWDTVVPSPEVNSPQG